MDIDYFKEFNDIYGHNLGDSVLRMVSQTMRYALRATDSIGRWGGEEFIAILHDVRDQEDLRVAAEKVRALVRHSRLDIDGQGLTVTISVGGTLLLASDTPDSLVGRADQLMYRSKHDGRNRVTIG
jgi:diguanylate cyclase (GGDEF)-like protein